VQRTLGAAPDEIVGHSHKAFRLSRGDTRDRSRSKTSVEGRTGVAVIGGGLTGVVAALHLARSGAKVDLFEEDTVGFGASGRNGGWSTMPATPRNRVPRHCW
jgi:FAD dependent oxidoreductase